jgi:hypothetical protein
VISRRYIPSSTIIVTFQVMLLSILLPVIQSETNTEKPMFNMGLFQYLLEEYNNLTNLIVHLNDHPSFQEEKVTPYVYRRSENVNMLEYLHFSLEVMKTVPHLVFQHPCYQILENEEFALDPPTTLVDVLPQGSVFYTIDKKESFRSM